MSGNTKYQPAPQRDSQDETTNYTEPPPSYQVETNSPQDPLLGSPRSEDDNVPDDFKVSWMWRGSSHTDLTDEP